MFMSMFFKSLYFVLKIVDQIKKREYNWQNKYDNKNLVCSALNFGFFPQEFSSNSLRMSWNVNLKTYEAIPLIMTNNQWYTSIRRSLNP